MDRAVSDGSSGRGLESRKGFPCGSCFEAQPLCRAMQPLMLVVWVQRPSRIAHGTLLATVHVQFVFLFRDCGFPQSHGHKKERRLRFLREIAGASPFVFVCVWLHV
mmetsp:Transcript_889/g.1931  ORF Transcript_889/g.1931 Transcript_889/m.1931 type:complete len:106 (+) Transcript_889:166-483(+)